MNTKVKVKQEQGITVIMLVITVIAIIIIGLLLMSIINKNERNDTDADGNTSISSEQEANKQETKNEEFVEKQADGSKLNTSEQLQKTKKLDGLEISNIQLKEIGGITTLLADVENKTNKLSEERLVTVEILDKQGKVITSLRGTVAEIPAGGKEQLNIGVTSDVSNAYDFRIK